MAIGIHPYTAACVPAVQEFNQRLARGGIAAEFRFPEDHTPAWLPALDGRRIFQRFFLALEDGVVRGGFILKQQDFVVHGELRPLTFYHLPLSEGIVNKKYAGIGVRMLRSALELAPELYCLGMGGLDRPLPRMLHAMGWNLGMVPFYFRINHPARFLTEIGPLREPGTRRWLARLAAFSGAGSGIKLVQRLRRRAVRNIRAEQVDAVGPWADEVWHRARPHYSLLGSRDAETLGILYPPHQRFLMLKVVRDGALAGWAVVLDTQMRAHKHFGDLRVGTLADALAEPANAGAVVQAATGWLEHRGVDLVVTNQAHDSWVTATRSAGFSEGPSNFVFAGSPAFMRLLAGSGALGEMYWNRGDGDGPVNL